ncbi:MAG: hypothetical protein M9899_02370 [Bdellovibrionaceae bacterium]|nr:hypothetical protein [Pseudobdellovibrionaceae bacterium]
MFNDKTCVTEKVQKYRINFLVKNRHGKKIFEKDYLWDRAKSFDGFNGVSADGGYHIVGFGKDIELGYSTVEYWLSEIVWKKEPPKRQDPDNIAFPLMEFNN